MGKRKIIWSKNASQKLIAILEFYASRNQSKTYSLKLYKRLNKEVLLLKKQPLIGIKTEVESVRGLIADHFILFYEISEEAIIIHSIGDSRQNPDHIRIEKVV